MHVSKEWQPRCQTVDFDIIIDITWKYLISRTRDLNLKYEGSGSIGHFFVFVFAWATVCGLLEFVRIRNAACRKVLKKIENIILQIDYICKCQLTDSNIKIIIHTNKLITLFDVIH